MCRYYKFIEIATIASVGTMDCNHGYVFMVSKGKPSKRDAICLLITLATSICVVLLTGGSLVEAAYVFRCFTKILYSMDNLDIYESNLNEVL